MGVVSGKLFHVTQFEKWLCCVIEARASYSPSLALDLSVVSEKTRDGQGLALSFLLYITGLRDIHVCKLHSNCIPLELKTCQYSPYILATSS